MRTPRPEKPQTFPELVTWATWQIISAITQGRTLQSEIYFILMNALNWRRNMDEYEKWEKQHGQTKK